MDIHNQKRTDYISWDEYFMGVAILSGMRSKDPNSQVGACIVSQDNKILSMGYNGFPIGCSDDAFPWAREGEPLDTKYLYVTHGAAECHSELQRGQPGRGKIIRFSFSPVTNVPRQSSSPVSRLWYITVTSMRTPHLS